MTVERKYASTKELKDLIKGSLNTLSFLKFFNRKIIDTGVLEFSNVRYKVNLDVIFIL